MLKITFIFFLVLSPAIVFGQKLDKKNPPKLTSAIKNIQGKNIRVYPVKCFFILALTEEEQKVAGEAKNWTVEGEKRAYSVDSVKFTFKKDMCYLHGKWDSNEKLTLFFSGKEFPINNEETKWEFGKGKAVDLNVRRLTQQKSLFAFDYDFKVEVVERPLSTYNRNIGLYTFSLDLASNGVFASDDAARNGTQTSIGLAVRPYLFAKDLVYFSKFNFSYQLETKMNETVDKLIDVTDNKLKLGFEFEVPLTNYPILKLHSRTGYVRVAMPLTISFDYLLGDEEGNSLEKFNRWDFKAQYELAFSPYLIVQAEWNSSWFMNTPEDFDSSTNYYSLAFAQDLDAVKKTLGFLKFILGPEEEIRGKNFIFFRISKGQKAPAFIDVNETSIGFGTYF